MGYTTSITSVPLRGTSNMLDCHLVSQGITIFSQIMPSEIIQIEGILAPIMNRSVISSWMFAQFRELFITNGPPAPIGIGSLSIAGAHYADLVEIIFPITICPSGFTRAYTAREFTCLVCDDILPDRHLLMGMDLCRLIEFELNHT